MAGIEIPSIAIKHTHILFEAIGAVEDRERMLPLVRDPDRSIYVRQEMDSLILGMYEKVGKQWFPEGVPWDYAQTELPEDVAESILESIPAEDSAEVRELLRIGVFLGQRIEKLLFIYNALGKQQLT